VRQLVEKVGERPLRLVTIDDPPDGMTRGLGAHGPEPAGEQPLIHSVRDRVAPQKQKDRAADETAGDERAEDTQEEAAGADTPIVNEAKTQADDECEPTERDFGDRLEGLEERAAEDSRRMRAQDEAERDVLDARGQTDAAGTAADEKARDVREDEQP